LVLDGGGWATGLYLCRAEGEQFQETLRAVFDRYFRWVIASLLAAFARPPCPDGRFDIAMII
jgi:hypothetical protein